jgi:hypothetical protein
VRWRIENHERKSGGGIADASRGSNALSGAVGTIVHLKKSEGNQPVTYRSIEVVSRYESFLNTLNWTGDEYVYLGSQSAVAEDLGLTAITKALPRTEAEAVTFKQLLERLPRRKPGSKQPSVSRTVAQKVLRKLRDGGFVKRLGTSTKKDPFRFYIRAEPKKQPKY